MINYYKIDKDVKKLKDTTKFSDAKYYMIIYTIIFVIRILMGVAKDIAYRKGVADGICSTVESITNNKER
jgi:hypothetical protein